MRESSYSPSIGGASLTVTSHFPANHGELRLSPNWRGRRLFVFVLVGHSAATVIPGLSAE